MHDDASGPGTRLGPLHVTVSEAANARYSQAAGVDHPLLAAGALYPPIAANLTVMLFQTVTEAPLLHTAQRLVCHRVERVGTPLVVTGTVRERFVKRGREYTVVEALIAPAEGDGGPVWTSIATFTEVGR